MERDFVAHFVGIERDFEAQIIGMEDLEAHIIDMERTPCGNNKDGYSGWDYWAGEFLLHPP